MFTRREVPSCGVAALVRKLRAAQQATVEWATVISRQPEFYHGWPTVAADSQGNLPNGKLLTVWYESMKDSPHAVLRAAQWTIS